MDFAPSEMAFIPLLIVNGKSWLNDSNNRKSRTRAYQIMTSESSLCISTREFNVCTIWIPFSDSSSTFSPYCPFIIEPLVIKAKWDGDIQCKYKEKVFIMMDERSRVATTQRGPSHVCRAKKDGKFLSLFNWQQAGKIFQNNYFASH